MDLANLAGSYLQAKKVRDLLESEIRSCSMEIEYINYRSETAAEALRKTMAAIEEIESRVTESQKRLLEAESERQAAVSENAEVEASERDLEGKRSMLPSLRRQVSELNEEVQEASSRLQTVETILDETVARKQGIEEEVALLEARLDRLVREVPIMENARDILTGEAAEEYDLKTFRNLQDGLEINFDGYVARVREEVADMEKEIASMKSHLDMEPREREALLLREDALRAAVCELSDHAPIDAARESVVSEVNALKAEQVRLDGEMEARRRELHELQETIGAVDQELRREKEQEQELSARLEYLNARARELDEIYNLPDELEKLRGQVSRLAIDLEVQGNFFKIMRRGRDEAESINASLKNAIADYEDVFGRLERLIRDMEESCRGDAALEEQQDPDVEP